MTWKYLPEDLKQPRQIEFKSIGETTWKFSQIQFNLREIFGKIVKNRKGLQPQTLPPVVVEINKFIN